MKFVLNYILGTGLVFLLTVESSSQALTIEKEPFTKIPFPTATAPGYSEYEEKYDVTFYFINLDASNVSTYVQGYTEIHAASLVTTLDSFVLELSDNQIVDSVLLQNKRIDIFTREEGLLKIFVPAGNQNDLSFRIIVHYHGLSGSGGFFSGISSETAYPWGNRITYTLSEPFQAKDWFPVKQNLRDKADSSWVFITTDSTLKVGSNGLLTGILKLPDGRVRYEWKSSYPIAYYLISFAVGDYQEYSFYAKLDDSDSVFVQNYLYDIPGVLEDTRQYVDQTSDLLRVFSRKFGKYPFALEKYGHCMAPMGGGMEHQTMTTMAGFNFGIVAHELAHSWFGNLVTCGTWQDIWINEGFASYCEYIALEELYSETEASYWLSEAHSLVFNYPGSGIYLSAEESRNVNRIFNYGLSYQKGGAIIHMLRYEINNDSLFFAILKDYLSEFSHNQATGRDFAGVVNEHTGQDYGWFFDQWYYGVGYPVFLTDWRQRGDSLIIHSTQTASSGDNIFFKTHCDFHVSYVDGSKEVFRVLYDSPEEFFHLPVSGLIINVQMDPYPHLIKSSLVYKFADFTKVFSVTPNPFTGQVNITFNSGNKYRKVSVCNLNGKEVYSTESYWESISPDLSTLSRGVYLLYVTEEDKTYTEKIIKQ